MGFIQPITVQGAFGTNRSVGSISLQVVISEETTDILTITKQPVQTGASITDHAFKEPTVLNMKILQQNNDLVSGILSTFSGGGLASVYKAFLNLQSPPNGVISPIVVITPKRIYKDMLVAGLRCTTDKYTENILSLDVTLQQVIIVNVGTTLIPVGSQRNPKVTQATKNLGTQQTVLKNAFDLTGE